MTVETITSLKSNDEQQIRDLIATWLRASASGDLPTILDLMAEDVVFLIAGQKFRRQMGRIPRRQHARGGQLI